MALQNYRDGLREGGIGPPDLVQTIRERAEVPKRLHYPLNCDDCQEVLDSAALDSRDASLFCNTIDLQVT